MFKEQLPSLMREFRKRANLTTYEVGELVGKSGKTVSAWECGRAQPDADMLLKLCRIYHVNIGDFYGEEPEAESFTLTDEEKQLIIDYRKSSDEMKQAIKALLAIHGEKAGQQEELLSSAG
ncbi:MAG: helix-turn-helix transcriptional regulator [Eubacteriales bacterium]|nr:helix-turn-helix transcriptional regulator [Eubacteriales bacterium]